jgi:protein-L-isoaspartate(D-aspartate) O-methyltransferase
VREGGARRRNRELVAHLQEIGVLTDPAVTAAFHAVLRHQFLPGRRLSYVYEDTAIPTKTDDKGIALSSSSQPAIMALMLQQLELEPGHRVLEIGAGTGYNAALMSHLVGPLGAVHSLDIDEELCLQARANLEGAGVRGVDVVHADGAEGRAEAAPFDRIMVTASVSDLALPWLHQLRDGGKLVAPLALAGPSHLCVAFTRRGGALASESLSCCGFLPLRGEMAFEQDSTEPADWLPLPGRPTWMSLPTADVPAGFKIWLALTHAGFVQVRLDPEAPPAFGLRDQGGVALAVAEKEAVWVYAYGQGQKAAEELLAIHRAWAARRPDPDQLRVAAYPSGEDPSPQAGQLVFRRPRFTFVVSQP